jgi:predicted transposase YbfD/YdcC
LPLLTAVRRHWSIENNLHWMLDVAFREDQCRTRNSAENLAVMRHAALDMLKREPTKIPIERNASKPPSTRTSEPRS